MHVLVYLYVFIVGTIIGSFLNVVICRVPEGQSIVYPGSHCPQCQNKLVWKQLIPLISFIVQRAKCAYCGTKIPATYPLVELFTGIVFALIYHVTGFTWLTLVYWILAACFIAVIVIDWKHTIIPDGINLTIFAVGIVASLTGITLPISEALIGGLTGGGILLLLAVASRGGMGGGDIKFLAAVGLFAGWKLVLVTLFLASITATIYGLVRILRLGYARGRQIPFGPFLAASAMAALLYGNQLIDYYLSLF